MFLNIGYGVPYELGNIGGFTNNYYWSSTENGIDTTWSQNFSNGDQNYGGKGSSQFVRAVRAF
jgi:hypothetical protein